MVTIAFHLIIHPTAPPLSPVLVVHKYLPTSNIQESTSDSFYIFHVKTASVAHFLLCAPPTSFLTTSAKKAVLHPSLFDVIITLKMY